MNTKQVNELFAQFLGWKESTWHVPAPDFTIGRKYDYELPNGLNFYKEEEIQIEGEWGYADVEQERCFVEDMKFKTDWNWLMLVVDKIESLGYWINRINGDVWIVNNENITIINNSEHDGGLGATLNACISFVKWFNNTCI